MTKTTVKTKNASLAAGNISLKIKEGVATYQVYGYVLVDRTDENYILLQPANLCSEPVMKIHRDNIAECIVQY